MMDFSLFIFLSVVMVAFGYMAGNAENFNKWKFALLALILVPFFIEYNFGKAHLLIMLIAFGVGFFLPYAHILEGLRDAISDAINSIRYRDAYEDIKRREAEVEELRRKYEEERREAFRKQQEWERKRRQEEAEQFRQRQREEEQKGQKNQDNSNTNINGNKAKSSNSVALIQPKSSKNVITCKLLASIQTVIIPLMISREPIAKWL